MSQALAAIILFGGGSIEWIIFLIWLHFWKKDAKKYGGDGMSTNEMNFESTANTYAKEKMYPWECGHSRMEHGSYICNIENIPCTKLTSCPFLKGSER